MSRSYKKTPGWFDRNPWAKRQANKRVRKTWDIPSGKSYRKLYDRYNIRDWICPIFDKATYEYIASLYGEHMYQAWIK